MKTPEEKREELESSMKTRKQKHSKSVKKPKNDFQPENAKALRMTWLLRREI
jgi:hypothetical protein